MIVLATTKHASTNRVAKHANSARVAKHNYSYISVTIITTYNYLLDPDGNVLLDPDGNPLLAGDGT